MDFEILHFRDAEKILAERSMKSDVMITCEYLFNALVGTKYRGELLREALEDMDWRKEGVDLKVLPGRRYLYKGVKHEVAIDGSLSSYEYLHTGLLRLQVGFDKGALVSGILLLPANRGEKSPYGNTSEMLRDEMEMLFPTINLPVTICLYNLGDSIVPERN
jgi:hypothetical protein